MLLEATEKNIMHKPNLKVFDVFYGNKCQLVCQQCDTRSDIVRTGEYDPDLESIKEGIQLSDQKFNILYYSLLGGEPLLYKDKIKSIIEFIRTLNQTAPIWVPTNGVLIEKNIDFLSEIMVKYGVMLLVGNHFVEFKDQTRSNKIKDSVKTLTKNINAQKVPNDEFWTKIMYDPSDEWKDYWVVAKDYTENTYSGITNTVTVVPDDDFWWNDNYGVLLVNQNSHNKHYYMKDNKPKPFNSTDIKKSYYANCPSCYCTFLYNKKLYKCAALATLKNFLEKHNAVDDEDWKKYLAYKPLDLTNCTEQEIINFAKSKYKPIKECSMCPSSTNIVMLTEENVLPINFYKK